MTLAFFGTGLMGSGFVQRLRTNGHAVQVWNRSPAKARALEGEGITAFATAGDAVKGASRIHLSLADDASVDAVLEPLAGVIPKDTWIVDHTTTAPSPTAERAARWRERGHTFVHAPVFMGPSNAHEGTGLMLVSGAQAHHDALLPDLQKMTGNVVYLGEAAERAAAFKLFGNLTLIGIMGVLGDVNRLAQACGISTAEAFSLFKHFNPGAMLPARAARIESGDVTKPSFEVTMARKDVRLMVEEAERGGFPLFVMPGVAAMFDAAIARGEGALDSAVAARVPK
ncbi:MAG: NAD(P)-dependent oxidoreductase [Rhizobacter sp.]